MAKQFPAIEALHKKFIAEQQMYFVATAAAEGRVNNSPKGMDSLRVLGPNRIVWLNLTGSGNETAGHLLKVNRMTLMWCSFTTRPLILRCYGTAKAVYPNEAAWAEVAAAFGPGIADQLGARQIYDMSIDMVQTSCGWAVPFYDHVAPRDTLAKWAQGKGAAAIATHWQDNNSETIDGLATK